MDCSVSKFPSILCKLFVLYFFPPASCHAVRLYNVATTQCYVSCNAADQHHGAVTSVRGLLLLRMLLQMLLLLTGVLLNARTDDDDMNAGRVKNSKKEQQN